MDIKKIRTTRFVCIRCNCEYRIGNLSETTILQKYDMLSTLCKVCRRFKECPICGIEFNSYQNQTCSKDCATELKKQSFLRSEGTYHNFCKNSKTKKKIERQLVNQFGVANQFAVPSTVSKIKNTMIRRYNVDNISKLPEIKERKKNTLAKSLILDPDLLKRSWWKAHDKLIDRLGYDNRIQHLPRTSKESLNFFKPLLEILNSANIKFFCGLDGMREFCIRDSQNKRAYFYDLVIPKLKLVIEYNHVSWHAKSPDQNWVHPISKQTAKDNFEQFTRKMKLIESYGYSVKIVWTDLDLVEQFESLRAEIHKKIK